MLSGEQMYCEVNVIRGAYVCVNVTFIRKIFTYNYGFEGELDYYRLDRVEHAL